MDPLGKHVYYLSIEKTQNEDQKSSYAGILNETQIFRKIKEMKCDSKVIIAKYSLA